MNENALQRTSLLFSNIIMFVVTIVVTYILITVIVHKSSFFKKLSKNGKSGAVKLLSVLAFFCLGYSFTKFGLT